MGRCHEAALAARTWIARDPSTSGGYFALAHALAQGSSSAPVQEALQQRWLRLPETSRAQRRLYEQALLDALHGHFDEAQKRTAELERLVSGSPNLEVHVLPIMLDVSILVETGHAGEAGKRAAEALERASAWSSSLLAESLDVPTYSFEPRMLHAAFRAGAIDEASYRRRLDVWARAARPGRVRGEEIVWALSAAIRAETPAEAAEVLASMPASMRSNGSKLGIWPVMWGPYAGRTLLQGGRIDEAIAQLHDSTLACTAFIEPIVHTQAYLWLGEALEKKGDLKGACDAYAVVASRWGHATPRSTTAHEAQERADALGCTR
jgi:predicted Zn-dependent protease